MSPSWTSSSAAERSVSISFAAAVARAVRRSSFSARSIPRGSTREGRARRSGLPPERRPPQDNLSRRIRTVGGAGGTACSAAAQRMPEERRTTEWRARAPRFIAMSGIRADSNDEIATTSGSRRTSVAEPLRRLFARYGDPPGRTELIANARRQQRARWIRPRYLPAHSRLDRGRPSARDRGARRSVPRQTSQAEKPAMPRWGYKPTDCAMWRAARSKWWRVKGHRLKDCTRGTSIALHPSLRLCPAGVRTSECLRNQREHQSDTQKPRYRSAPHFRNLVWGELTHIRGAIIEYVTGSVATGRRRRDELLDTYTFWPCNSTQFHQSLKVWDAQSGYAYTSSTATETGGGGCLIGGGDQ